MLNHNFELICGESNQWDSLHLRYMPTTLGMLSISAIHIYLESCLLVGCNAKIIITTELANLCRAID